MTTEASATGAHAEDFEDLLDRARLGHPTDAAERRRLQVHLASCHICAVQVRNAASTDQPEYVSAGVAHLDRIALHRALRALPSATRRRRLSLSHRWAQVVLATVLVSGTAVAASWLSARGGSSLFSPKRGGRSVADHRHPIVAVVPQPTFQPQPAGAVTPAQPVASGGSADTVIPNPARIETEATRGRSVGIDPGDDSRADRRDKVMGAAELFDRARKLRVAGDFAGAQAMYRRLQHGYPASRETHFSHLILGRMLLDGGRPEQGARQFALYLSAGGGASEEALVGHATALARLGRGKEEAADWQALLTRHPTSVYAGQAQARLAELGHAPNSVRFR